MPGTLIKGLKSGYDGVENALRTSADQKFQIWCDKPKRIEPLRDASIRAAKEVRASTDREIIVLYSGGADSEWVMESFFLANIKVTPLIVVFEDNLNQHDVDWANRYLHRRGYKEAIYYRVNLREWYKSSLMREIALRTQTPELAYTPQFQAVIASAYDDQGRDTNRFFITGYDEPQISANDITGTREWDLTYMERHYSVAKLFDQYNIHGASWGAYSPELFAAFLRTPQFQMMVANMYNPLCWNSEMLKFALYNYSFPFMEPRTKYTGYERALEFVVPAAKDWQAEMKEQLGFNWTSSWTANVKDVWRDMLGVPA